MSLRVNTNIAAMNSYRNLTATDNASNKSLEKLSSGLRINRAADDAAGLVNSEALRAQVGGLKVATRNAQDSISVAQTAEGALNEVTSILQRVRDLSVQKANGGGNSTTASDAIDAEISSLADEIGRIGDTAKFNGHTLLQGGYTGSFQVGANEGEKVTLAIGLDLDDVKKAVQSVLTTPPSGVTASTAALTDIDTQITSVSGARGTLGAFQNRMEHTIANLGVAVENLSASESRIRDTDMAMEMTTQSRNSILAQAGTAMLAQANQSSQGVLKLLQG